LYLSFLIPGFVSHVQVLHRSLVGARVLLKIYDSEPIPIGEISPKARVHTTANFSKGTHLELKIIRPSLPSKLPFIVVAQTPNATFAGGVNALELLRESMASKRPSSVASEHIKVFSEEEGDGGIFILRLRITSGKVPRVENPKPMQNPPVGDMLRMNEHYRQKCRELAAQVSNLESQVDRFPGGSHRIGRPVMSAREKGVTFEPTGNRTRPPIDYEFESGPSAKAAGQGKRKKKPEIEQEVVISSDGSEAFGSDRGKRKRTKKRDSDVSDFNEYQESDGGGNGAAETDGSVVVESDDDGGKKSASSVEKVEDVSDVEVSAGAGSDDGGNDGRGSLLRTNDSF
jgi:hypothetical protein